MFKKLLIYLKLTVCNVFKNKIRVFLTITGISIGIIVFIIGSTVVNSYIDGMYNNALAFDKCSYILTGQKEAVDWACNYINYPIQRTYRFSPVKYYVNEPYKYKDTKIQTAMTIIGAEQDITSSTVYYFGNSGYAAAPNKLLYGRDISYEDIKNKTAVALIEKSAAIYLFQKENAVGEYISVNIKGKHFDFKVIGVLEDFPNAKQINFEFNINMLQNSGNEYTIYQSVYVPITLFDEYIGDLDIAEDTTIYCIRVSEEDKLKTDQSIEALKEADSVRQRYVHISSQAQLLKNAQNSQKEADGIIGIAMMLIILISGFMILTVFLFSIKERIYEIGIRRAVGASNTDIAIQFMSEGIILGVISIIISAVLSIHISTIITHVLKNIYYINVDLRVDLATLSAGAGIALIQSIVYSFVPAIYAAKIRPTEAIRWD